MGENARHMTQRELNAMTQQDQDLDLNAECEKREKAVDMAMEKAIRFEEKGEAKRVVTLNEEVEDNVDDIYTSMSKLEMEAILHECEGSYACGNEAFIAGEYAQALLLYSLALDKNALVGKELAPVGTPYMKVFECLALSHLDVKLETIGAVRDYWKGMLDKGASIFLGSLCLTQTKRRRALFHFYDCRTVEASATLLVRVPVNFCPE